MYSRCLQMHTNNNKRCHSILFTFIYSYIPDKQFNTVSSFIVDLIFHNNKLIQTYLQFEEGT